MKLKQFRKLVNKAIRKFGPDAPVEFSFDIGGEDPATGHESVARVFGAPYDEFNADTLGKIVVFLGRGYLNPDAVVWIRKERPKRLKKVFSDTSLAIFTEGDP